MIIFHLSLFFTFLTLAPVMCVVFLFSFYKLRLPLQRTQHTGGKFTERVLPRPCSVHRDQILPRCSVCEYNYIPLHRRYQHQSCCYSLFYRARDLSVPSSFLFMSSSSSLDLQRKQEQSRLLWDSWGKHKEGGRKKIIKVQSFKQSV